MDFEVRLHLGAHKTASTHLQQMLQKNRPALRGLGVGYAGPKLLRQAGRSHDHAYGLHPEGADAVQVRANLIDMANGAARLVLSEENMLGRKLPVNRRPMLYPKAEPRIAPLVAQLAGAQVSLYLAIREPARWMSSLYRQNLTGGEVQDFAQFAAKFRPETLRWSELVARLRGLPGVQDVVIWRYEDYADHTAAILSDLVGAQLGPDFKLTRDVVHRGISREAVEAILAWDGVQPFDALAKEARQAFHLDKGFTPFEPWPKDVLERSAAAYRDDVARIATMPGVRLLCPGDAASA